MGKMARSRCIWLSSFQLRCTWFAGKMVRFRRDWLVSLGVMRFLLLQPFTSSKYFQKPERIDGDKIWLGLM